MRRNKTTLRRFGELPVKSVFFSDGNWLWKNSAFFATEFDIEEMAILADMEMSEYEPCVFIGFAETELEIRTLILAALS